MSNSKSIAYVRTDEAPTLPAPPGTVGLQAWLRQNLFPSIPSTILTVIVGLILFLIAWSIINWAIFTAVWTGEDRTNCAAEGAGACWPFVWAKFPQWIYGFYPIDQRWRATIVFIIGAVALVPMLIPSAPYKLWNALFLIIAFPLITLILLSGGNFNFSAATYGGIVALGLLASILIPFVNSGIESGIKGNPIGLLFGILALLPAIFWFAAEILTAIDGIIGLATGIHPLIYPAQSVRSINGAINDVIPLGRLFFGLAVLAALATLYSVLSKPSPHANATVAGWVLLVLAVLAIFLLLDIDFGLIPVETQSWGGLLVTLVVSVTGIAASLPLGILLALGRRSQMPVVRLFSVVFIEVWRGVPLITVLFMSSVMLPLFLPEGMNFDKLLRALIGISLFSAAYMAEVVRGGLQAIPKGQYEGAMALGLSYWQMMGKIILPQALKISIPNIVGNFIGLFKDTTLVLIIGIYDFLGIITAGTQDAKWASPQTGNTGYFAAAVIYWAFCFGMSRYAMYTERRLNTGHKR